MHLFYVENDLGMKAMLDLIDRLGAIPANMLASLATSGKRARLSILIYHRVLEEPDTLTDDQCDKDFFELQIRTLSRYFNVLPMPEAIQRLKEKNLPSKAACITFDDGYADNVENALPILQKFGVPATFFVAAGFIDNGVMWNDKIIELIRHAPGDHLDLNAVDLGKYEINSLKQRRETLFALINKIKYLPLDERHALIERLYQLIPVALPDNIMMTTDQLKQLHRAGMEIGGHTLSHPILARIEYKTAYDEIAKGKSKLENIIQAPVRFFAYPNGKPGQDYLPEHVTLLKKIGFEAAFVTASGAANYKSDIYQLPRFTPCNTDRTRFILRMTHNMFKATVTVSPDAERIVHSCNPL
jgi:peptidoglycan/xylan/chitin deacetylase (PgdA/CDA1 family)